ncbi:hypothetical protein CI105_03345 [Candidatus Izimaplasma bacterium ZiA1]|uniref:sulfatase-like hydrolase/transferase n=1 Tax=Candidatus Izimoplasma sp. ZiA1 TaxID=2024899 RepID=UPI000BAA6325|nr:hypothetical protein CI105_03345 [Candidatus Izimaplasma bacterium ZiA1]
MNTINSNIKGYIATQLEAEYLVENLIKDLEAKGELDDTVILFTNDHYPYTLDQDSYANYKNIEDEFMKNKGVLYIWSNDIVHSEITKLSSSFDILPTINNMFGLDGNYNNYIGNDIFGDTESLVYFKDFTFYDGTTLYDLSKSSTGNESLLNYVRKQYELSRRILKVDYFKEE